MAEMTREEAINFFSTRIKRNIKLLGSTRLDKGYTEALVRMNEAYSMAKSALTEKKGEWIKDGSVYRCSNCNHYPMGNIASEKFENLSRLDAFYFCPHCGADMRPETYKGESEEV